MSTGYIYGFADGPQNKNSIISQLSENNPEQRIDINSATFHGETKQYIPPLSEQAQKIIKYLQDNPSIDELVCHSFGCIALLKAIEIHPELTKRFNNIVFLAPPLNQNRFNQSCQNIAGKNQFTTTLNDQTKITYDLSEDFLKELESINPIIRYLIAQISSTLTETRLTIIEAEKDELKSSETELAILNEAIPALKNADRPLDIEYHLVKNANHYFTQHKDLVIKLISDISTPELRAEKESFTEPQLAY